MSYYYARWINRDYEKEYKSSEVKFGIAFDNSVYIRASVDAVAFVWS